MGVQIDPAGLFLCQGGVGGNFDGGYRRTQRHAPPAQGVGSDAGQAVAAAAFQPDFQFADRQGTASVRQCPGNAVYSPSTVK